MRTGVLALLLLAGSAVAGTLTTTITYQGELEFDGEVANGEFDFEVVLFDAANGGNDTAKAQVDDHTVQAGLFTLPLDFGGNAFTGDEIWLELRVRPGAENGAYTVLAPRQRVTAAPYALYAETVADDAVSSGNIEDASIMASDLADGAVGAQAIDSAQVQERVLGSCSSTQAIRGINENGTVVCSGIPQGDIIGITTVVGTSGLDGGCTSGTCSLRVDPTDFNSAAPIRSQSTSATLLTPVDSTAWQTLFSFTLTSGSYSGSAMLTGNARVLCANCSADETQSCELGFTTSANGAPPSTGVSRATVGRQGSATLRDNVSNVAVFSQTQSNTQTYYLRARAVNGGPRCSFSYINAAGIFVPN